MTFLRSAEKVLLMNTQQAYEEYEKNKNAEDVQKHVQLGKELIFKGYAKKNNMYDRLEFVVNSVEEVDAKKEINSLLEKVK